MNVVIFGIGKQAELVHYLFSHDTEHQVVGFCVDAAYVNPQQPTLFSLPIISIDDLPILFPPASHQLHIAVGNNEQRASTFAAVRALHYTCINYVSSKAQTWPDLVMGQNVYIDPATRIHPFVTVGNNTILGGTSIGHHAVIESNVMASSATVGAKCTIGSGSYLGINCVIREGVTIGKNNVIGACAYVDQDTEDDAVYSGTASKKRNVPASRVAFFNK
jgi:bifunctional N-acetylglucosamine-1-phosphate-uridyltransferase/glucosamine-1-phosphate-acetyltransferase GlmU-like protein